MADEVENPIIAVVRKYEEGQPALRKFLLAVIDCREVVPQEVVAVAEVYTSHGWEAVVGLIERLRAVVVQSAVAEDAVVQRAAVNP